MPATLSKSEKLAFVKMIDSIINADEIIHDAEIEIMSQLMERFHFDSAFVAQAKKENMDDCVAFLLALPQEKKSVIIKMLKTVAISDGVVHKKEIAMIIHYCERIGLCKKIG